MKNKIFLFVAILALIALTGFAPIKQGVQRFVTILTQRITVSTDLTSQGTSNFDGAVDFDSTVDFAGATVQNLGSYYATEDDGAVIITGTLTVSDTATFTSAVVALDTWTVTGATALNGGLTMDTSAFSVANTTGNTIISGTLTVSSTSTLNDDLNMVNQPILNIGAAGTDFSTVGGLTTASTITVTAGGLVVSAGDTDLAAGLNYGADNLYPLGYASTNQQMVCGTTELTESLEIAATGLTTVTYVIATQITTPAATGALLTASDPTTSTFVLYSWEADYTAGTTPVSAHWCAVGDQ